MFSRIRFFIRDAYWNFRRNCQRFSRGYSWGDVWDMYSWFLETLEPMLRHLQKEHMGHPGKYSDDEWTERLGKMADCLHLMDECNVIEEVYGGDYMNKGIAATMEENKKKFFEMFAEDFYSLWD